MGCFHVTWLELNAEMLRWASRMRASRLALCALNLDVAEIDIVEPGSAQFDIVEISPGQGSYRETWSRKYLPVHRLASRI